MRDRTVTTARGKPSHDEPASAAPPEPVGAETGPGASGRPSKREAGPGDRVADGYGLQRLIAQGGAASVLEAVECATGRRVAVKLLHPKLRAQHEAQARLFREARALALASHRNVVACIDQGVDAQWGPYLVLELLEGRALSGVLAARRRLDPHDALRLVVPLCDAMANAHEHGVLHRDIKPQNVFVAVDRLGNEAPKLLDFGVAALDAKASPPRDRKLTVQGAILGTPEYMAPEQLTGDEMLDGRCDVYGLGVTLFECLTGEVPFEGNIASVVRQLWTMPVPSPRERRAELPERLSEVVRRALARQPAERYPTARALASALREALPEKHEHGSLLGLQQAEPRAAERLTTPTRSLERPVEPPARLSTTALRRRRHHRAPYVTPIAIERDNGTTVLGRTEDISEGGLLILTSQPLAEAEPVRIHLALPGSGQHVALRAVARWGRSARTVGAIGLELVEPPADVVRLVRAHVERFAPPVQQGPPDAPA